jgi:hypothetical protein
MEFAKAAITKNIDGITTVSTSNPFPKAYSKEDRNRHFLASESNFLPWAPAHKTRVTLPSASFNTHIVAAEIPKDFPLKPRANSNACVLKTLQIAVFKR